MDANIQAERGLIQSDVLSLTHEKHKKVLDTSGLYRIINSATKRSIDIIGSIVGIILLLPIIIFVFTSKIRNKEKGPMFFTQERIGKNGRLFKIYKFRTMVLGADTILEKLLKENKQAREEYKIHKKLKNDPRVTKIGDFLRRTSLDEFPQFINVLKGEMSLVGPRPYLPREAEEMGNYHNYIVQTKPGVTGLWQVSGRSDVAFGERLQLDLEYYNHHSVIIDIKLLLKTVLKIVKHEGAI